MLKRRSIEVFSLSFLDCLCCGFGAILLIFLLTIGTGSTRADSSPTTEELETMRLKLAESQSLVAQHTVELESRINPIERLKALEAVQALEKEIESRQQERDTIQKQLSRSEESRAVAKRLLRNFSHADMPPLGLPADSTHVAFVIDTSGSMRHPLTKQLHEAVLTEITGLLQQLPAVRAIQFIDSSGNYMIPRNRGLWLSDTSALRNQAIRTLRRYPVLSVSDPAPGIARAFRDLRGRLKNGDRMAIYMLGDDFRGSTSAFLVRLNALNPRSSQTGQRAVSISAVGFPTLAKPFQLRTPQGNVRFANIMREIASEHEGVLILKPRI